MQDPEILAQLDKIEMNMHRVSIMLEALVEAEGSMFIRSQVIRKMLKILKVLSVLISKISMLSMLSCLFLT